MNKPDTEALGRKGDPIVAALKRSQLKPTVKNYLQAAYPDQELEDLLEDPEVMSMLPPELDSE